MSIIFEGIDIPKDGYIPMRIYANGHIWINGSYKGVAIQIPKGHGDLIDRNQVFTYSHRDVKNLEEVPVILEGEEW